LGEKPQHCVAIEDTAFGVRSAKAAGVRVVAVCHSMKREELAAADRVVASTAELTLDDLAALANIAC
jgi:beta-phosphoglucomutase-like phosphatase (HAD superfamily)